jgi:hypothetical protein
MSDLKDTMYIDGVWFSYHGDNELAEKTLRETLGAAHHFRPSDHEAVHVANLMTELHQFSILTIALQVLKKLWARAAGTFSPRFWPRPWPSPAWAAWRASLWLIWFQ